ncbi:MAG TPA: amidohydrolase family protein [Chloroflexota bacterium]|nr:amidohydrolase family protein [Chloroflexota bacterium]
MRIDVHAHYYTPEFMARMRALGCSWRPNREIVDTAGLTDLRAEHLAAGGVDLQVLSVGAQQPYLQRVEDAVEGARYANDFYRQAVERGGGRYGAFGCVPLPHVSAAIAEARRCLDTLGFLGINLGCSTAGRALDDPDFHPFWAELDSRRAVVFLHPLGVGGPLQKDFGLAWSVGAMFEDTIAALRLARSGHLDRFPHVKIIVPHLGGTLPFVWDRVTRSDPRAAAGLRRLYYDTVNGTPSALRCACETLGADRLMLGTDYSYHTPQECVSDVEVAGLAPNEVTGILDRNAQALLGVGASA